jgi:hypothetical protein
MDAENPKFVFPSRGFYIVADKVAEADFFLERLQGAVGHIPDFGFFVSAFVSAARSVTFVLQAVMSHYPGFDSWYPSRQSRLQQSNLARFFVELRNHALKVGDLPISQGGVMRDGRVELYSHFIPNAKFNSVPDGDIVTLCREYLTLVISVVAECYRDYDVYVDPRVIFTRRGLTALGWSIEDLEEALGFPRGHTDIPWPDNDRDEQRLAALSRYGGDELMEEFILKYLGPG